MRLRDLVWRIMEALQPAEILEVYAEVCDMQDLGLRAAKVQ